MGISAAVSQVVSRQRLLEAEVVNITGERRRRHALDESYNYYKRLEKQEDVPELLTLAKSLHNVLAVVDKPPEQFKLTRQLWSKVYYALFDKLITCFPGYCLVVDGEGKQIDAGKDFPANGRLEFHPEGLKRSEDTFFIEIKHLYPATLISLKKAWKSSGAMIKPDHFVTSECGPGGCYIKPLLLGEEVLVWESRAGKDAAYQIWWELYWQAYGAADELDKASLFHRMNELEAVWGNLNY